MSAFDDLSAMQPLQIWDEVIARSVTGGRLTLAVVELEPNSLVPEHKHDHEQLGIVLTGSLNFRVGEEARDLGPGGTWRIESNAPHEVQVGPEGAVVIDVFAPTRDDWESAKRLEPRTPRWP